MEDNLMDFGPVMILQHAKIEDAQEIVYMTMLLAAEKSFSWNDAEKV